MKLRFLELNTIDTGHEKCLALVLIATTKIRRYSRRRQQESELALIPKLALKYANNGEGFQTDLMIYALKEHGLVCSALEFPNKYCN